MTWVNDFRAAMRRNLSHPGIRMLRGHADAVDQAVELWRGTVPYRFDGPFGHRITDIGACLQRGYGACGDACAFVGAAALINNQPAELCVEAVKDLRDYRHVSLVVDGWPVDPTPAEHILPADVDHVNDPYCQVGACAWRLDLWGMR